MKRNLLTLIILMILIVNTVLTAIMMINVSSASKKTAALVENISAMVTMDSSGGGAAGAVHTNVAPEDRVIYNVEGQLTIPLAPSADGSAHYCVTSVTLLMNSKSDGYAAYGEQLAANESLIKSAVSEVIRGYSMEEAQAATSLIKEDCLAAVQAVFNSDFIYDVQFPDVLYQ